MAQLHSKHKSQVSSTVLRAVLEPDLTEEDMKLIQRAAEAGPEFYRMPEPAFRRAVKEYEFQVFRVVVADKMMGIIVTEVNHNPHIGQKRLNIVRLAGRGLVFHLDAVLADVLRLAQDFGCIAVDGVVYDRKLAQAYIRKGGKPESVNFTISVEKAHG